MLLATAGFSNTAVVTASVTLAPDNKKAVLSQGNRTMPKLFFSV